MDEIAKLSGLQAAIAKATIEVGGFIADKRNADQNYSYISADAILERGGLALAKVGVSVIPAVTSWDVKFTARQGKSDRIDVLVNFDMAVLCGDEKINAPWAGCGSDYSTPDKALYKAITSGHKYFLMKLLNIGIGNSDSEQDGDDDQRKPATQQKPAAQSKPAPVTPPQPEIPQVRVAEPPAPEPSVNHSNTTTNGNGKGARPMEPEALKKAIASKAGKHAGAIISAGAKGLMVGQMNTLFDGDENKRHQFTRFLTGYGSTKDMPPNVCQSILDWLADADMARREANAVIAYLDGQNGQMSLPA